MKMEKIKPIPKKIEAAIKRLDKKTIPRKIDTCVSIPIWRPTTKNL